VSDQTIKPGISDQRLVPETSVARATLSPYQTNQNILFNMMDGLSQGYSLPGVDPEKLLLLIIRILRACLPIKGKSHEVPGFKKYKFILRNRFIQLAAQSDAKVWNIKGVRERAVKFSKIITNFYYCDKPEYSSGASKPKNKMQQYLYIASLLHNIPKSISTLVCILDDPENS